MLNGCPAALCRSGTDISLSGLPVRCLITVLSDCICKVPGRSNVSVPVSTCISVAHVSVDLHVWLNLVCECVFEGLFTHKNDELVCSFFSVQAHTCDSYNELWSDDPINNGTEERRDDSDTDEDDRCHELKDRKRVKSWGSVLEQRLKVPLSVIRVSTYCMYKLVFYLCWFECTTIWIGNTLLTYFKINEWKNEYKCTKIVK